MKDVVITSARDLQAFIELKRSDRFDAAGEARAVFDIAGVASETTSRWQSAIEQSLDECGCRWAFACAMLSLIGATAWLVVQIFRGDVRLGSFLLFSFLAMTGATVAGKVVGLLAARWRLQRILKEMRAREAQERAGAARGRDAEGEPRHVQKSGADRAKVRP